MSFDGKAFGAGRDERLNGAETNRGHIETHVLLGFGDFDDREAALRAKLAGPADASVGAFDGFDRDHGAAFDGDALANVETTHFLGQRPAIVDVG